MAKTVVQMDEYTGKITKGKIPRGHTTEGTKTVRSSGVIGDVIWGFRNKGGGK